MIYSVNAIAARFQTRIANAVNYKILASLNVSIRCLAHTPTTESAPNAFIASMAQADSETPQRSPRSSTSPDVPRHRRSDRRHRRPLHVLHREHHLRRPLRRSPPVFWHLHYLLHRPHPQPPPVSSPKSRPSTQVPSVHSSLRRTPHTAQARWHARPLASCFRDALPA